MISFDEIELKFGAGRISVDQFKSFCEKHNPLQYINQHGRDTFFYNEKEPESFCRHRTGVDTNQLTFKKKTCVDNSVVRNEINVDLARSTEDDTIVAYLDSMHYKKQNSINKTSIIYIYDSYVMAYYICYDSNMVELGRFVEIEIREDKDLGSIQDKLAHLNILEKLCKPLGITTNDRIKANLFEMYGKVLTKASIVSKTKNKEI